MEQSGEISQPNGDTTLPCNSVPETSKSCIKATAEELLQIPGRYKDSEVIVRADCDPNEEIELKESTLIEAYNNGTSLTDMPSLITEYMNLNFENETI